MARDYSSSKNWEQESRYNFRWRNNFDDHLPLKRFARRSKNSMMQLSTSSWNNENDERDYLNILIGSKSVIALPFPSLCYFSFWIFLKMLDFSKLLNRQSCNMDFCLYCCSLYLSPFDKQNLADQDFKACWSFCFELKVLNESKYSMSWVRCAFGNV